MFFVYERNFYTSNRSRTHLIQILQDLKNSRQSIKEVIGKGRTLTASKAFKKHPEMGPANSGVNSTGK